MIPNAQRIKITNLKSLDKISNKFNSQSDKKDTSPKQSIPSLFSSPPNTPKPKIQTQKLNAKQSYPPDQTNQRASSNYRALMNERLQKGITKANYHLDQQQMIEKIENVKQALQIKDDEEYINMFFFLYDEYMGGEKKGVKDQLTINLKTLSRKKLLLTSEKEFSVKRKKSQMIQSQNDNLKKELFKSRQTNKTLEKRLLSVLEDFRKRKATYISEIQKLTNLINSSIQQIPLLIINQNRRASQPLNQQRDVADMQQHHKKNQNEDYNSIHIQNEAQNSSLMFGLSGVYKAYEQIVDYEPKHFSDPKKIYKSSSYYVQENDK